MATFFQTHSYTAFTSHPTIDITHKNT